ncbi:hypothetical protein [Nocardioides sp. URHA0020]|uniref:hypothetical protein n=1 Tax=Nocardioides sp. URHA0020 TaxID=1380392 RepID=UPI00048C8B07|nr:hypothetical protein [Nocardioides sp. URHA0020]
MAVHVEIKGNVMAARTVRLRSESGHFEIQPADAADWTVSPVSTNLLRADEPGALLMVLTGSQDGPFRAELQVLDARPAVDETWEDIVEVSINTPTGLVISDVPPGRIVDLVDGEGEYRVRVNASGRSKARVAEAGAAEKYLVQVWPAPVTEATLVAGCGDLEPSIIPFTELPEYQAAVAGAALIGRALDAAGDGMPALSGERGDVVVERVLSTRQSVAYATMSVSVGFEYGFASSSGGRPVGWFFNNELPEHQTMRLTGSGGRVHVRITRLEMVKPRRARVKWEWVRPPAGSVVKSYYEINFEQLVPVLDLPPEREVTVEKLSPAEDGTPQSLVRITHHDLPIEWVDAMRAYWDFHLAYSASLAPINQ